MPGFIMKKTAGMLLVLLGATFLTYAMILLAPGDAAREIAVARYGGEARLDQATVEWIRQKEGLEKPFLIQYGRWLSHVVQLDFGYSLVEEAKVLTLISTRFAKTFELAAAAIFIALAVSLPLGTLAGIKPESWLDSASISLSVLGLSIPNFWLGLLLISFFSVHLHWLPSFGTGSWQHMIMPALTLGTSITAYIARLLRLSVIQSLKSDYVLALRARGTDSFRVLSKHVVKNTLIPLVTIAGLEFGLILEGAVITEVVFSWPGLGSLMVDAICNRDYPLIQGVVLFTGTIFVLINFGVDLICSALDPRIRLK
ncbi:ABC transporter permease [uncultured Desulfobacter sp.]|uniref:ABC transporter permease n=1 Tax=uncultured Desulfobacter sp. TaxID=240139 RepID=UPI002AAB4745|nr:ABC transporter permease [uncultured Desulfobacter sp.]